MWCNDDDVWSLFGTVESPPTCSMQYLIVMLKECNPVLQHMQRLHQSSLHCWPPALFVMANSIIKQVRSPDDRAIASDWFVNAYYDVRHSKRTRTNGKDTHYMAGTDGRDTNTEKTHWHKNYVYVYNLWMSRFPNHVPDSMHIHHTTHNWPGLHCRKGMRLSLKLRVGFMLGVMSSDTCITYVIVLAHTLSVSDHLDTNWARNVLC